MAFKDLSSFMIISFQFFFFSFIETEEVSRNRHALAKFFSCQQNAPLMI